MRWPPPANHVHLQHGDITCARELIPAYETAAGQWVPAADSLRGPPDAVKEGAIAQVHCDEGNRSRNERRRERLRRPGIPCGPRQQATRREHEDRENAQARRPRHRVRTPSLLCGAARAANSMRAVREAAVTTVWPIERHMDALCFRCSVNVYPRRVHKRLPPTMARCTWAAEASHTAERRFRPTRRRGDAERKTICTRRRRRNFHFSAFSAAPRESILDFAGIIHGQRVARRRPKDSDCTASSALGGRRSSSSGSHGRPGSQRPNSGRCCRTARRRSTPSRRSGRRS